MKNILIILLPAVVCTMTLYSQDPEWINYTNGDKILCIEMEGDLVWIGTNGGLVKYDRSSESTVFYNRSNSGLPSNGIFNITIDKSGQKWIGTSEGLVKFDGVTWTVYNSSNSGLPSNLVQCIMLDPSGNKWIGTGDGLVKYNGTDWNVIETPFNVGNISLGDSGVIWIAQDSWPGVIAKYNGTSWTAYNESNCVVLESHIDCMTTDDSGNVWIASWAGLAYFDGIMWTDYMQSDSTYGGHPTCIKIDEEGNKWIGALGGLSKFNDKDWTIFSGLPGGGGVSTIEIDESGIPWIGSTSYEGWGSWSGDGLYKLNGAYWTNINTSSSLLPDDGIMDIALDKNNKKWLVTGEAWLGQQKNIVSIEGNAWTIYNNDNSILPEEGIICIAVDQLDNKWIGTRDGLIEFDNSDWTLFDGPISTTSIAIDNTGNKWLGTSGEGLWKYDNETWINYNTSNSELLNDNMECIAVDSDGNKWIGTSEGLSKFNDSGWTNYGTSISGILTGHSSCMAIDKSGFMWFGMGFNYGRVDGLVQFDGSNFTKYNESNTGMPLFNVQDIVIDESNMKWFGTSGGLVKFDNENWTLYDVSNSGIVSNNVMSIAIDSFGNKWIGTEAGLSVFREKESALSDLNESRTYAHKAKIYPNPTSELLSIETEYPGHYSINITSLNGQQIFIGEMEGSFHQIDLSSFQKGVYLITIRSLDFVTTKKIIKL